MDIFTCYAKTSIRWGGKDGKWRWLVEVIREDDGWNGPQEVGAKAGEERRYADALMAAANAAEEILDGLR